jgi:hypothetical protein
VLQGPRGRRRPVTGLLDVIASRIGGCSPREAAWLRQVEMKTLDRDPLLQASVDSAHRCLAKGRYGSNP